MEIQAYRLEKNQLIVIKNEQYRISDISHSRGGGRGARAKIWIRCFNDKNKIDEIVCGTDIFQTCIDESKK